jgi:hypothetical protein
MEVSDEPTLVEPSADRTAGLEEQNERLRAVNERLRGLLRLPTILALEAEIESLRPCREGDPHRRVNGRCPEQVKIGLFRTLLRSREAVYARCWCDDRTVKKGDSPAAREHSGRGTKGYLPLTDEDLDRHFAGNTCRDPLQPQGTQGRAAPTKEPTGLRPAGEQGRGRPLREFPKNLPNQQPPRALRCVTIDAP